MVKTHVMSMELVYMSIRTSMKLVYMSILQYNIYTNIYNQYIHQCIQFRIYTNVYALEYNTLVRAYVWYIYISVYSLEYTLMYMYQNIIHYLECTYIIYTLVYITSIYTSVYIRSRASWMGLWSLIIVKGEKHQNPTPNVSSQAQ